VNVRNGRKQTLGECPQWVESGRLAEAAPPLASCVSARTLKSSPDENAETAVTARGVQCSQLRAGANPQLEMLPMRVQGRGAKALAKQR
jgi:hypothetical protein